MPSLRREEKNGFYIGDAKMKEAEHLDYLKLKKGDFFRGMNWKTGGKNHIFNEVIKLSTGQEYIASLCHYWFYTYGIYEPSENIEENICSVCKNKRDRVK